MYSTFGNLIRRQALNSLCVSHSQSTRGYLASNWSGGRGFGSLCSDSSVSNGVGSSKIQFLRSFHRVAPPSLLPGTESCSQTEMLMLSSRIGRSPALYSLLWADSKRFLTRSMTTAGNSDESVVKDSSEAVSAVTSRIKFKRLDKTARHIMQIINKEAVEEVKSQREIPDIKPGYIVELKVEVPENKRRVSTVRGIVIARRNAGINTTFRLRRIVEKGIGVESLFPLYSPNIKEIKVLDKKKVRRAKLYYLRDKMNALKKS
uniref:Uncharacterized protein n=2 Tax=Rhizophora mucronata TaxID=61149 RepID=A0A2P2JTN3_RHIMU